MQAGLTRRQLTFREIFDAGIAFLASKNVLFALRNGPAGQFPYSGSASGGLATIDDGSTPFFWRENAMKARGAARGFIERFEPLCDQKQKSTE